MLHELLKPVISLKTLCSCKDFKEVAKQASVLKLLNFRDSISTCTLDYRKHRHPKDILFLCARYGNQIAEFSFGKVTDF